MNCYTFKDRVSDYLDKKLSLKEIKSYEQKLKACICCSEIHNGVKSLIKSSKKLKHLSVSPDFNSKLFINLKKSKNPNENIFYKKNFYGYKPKYLLGTFVSTILIFMIIFNLSNNNSKYTSDVQSTSEDNLLNINKPNTFLSNESNIDSIADSTQRKNKNNFLKPRGKTVDFTP